MHGFWVWVEGMGTALLPVLGPALQLFVAMHALPSPMAAFKAAAVRYCFRFPSMGTLSGCGLHLGVHYSSAPSYLVPRVGITPSYTLHLDRSSYFLICPGFSTLYTEHIEAQFWWSHHKHPHLTASNPVSLDPKEKGKVNFQCTEQEV